MKLIERSVIINLIINNKTANMETVRDYHYSNDYIHPGQKTLQKTLTESEFDTKGLRQKLTAVTQLCIHCQRSKPAKGKKNGAYQIISTPEEIFSDVSIDILRPIYQTLTTKNYAIVMVDRFSRFIIGKTFKDSPTSKKITELVENEIKEKYNVVPKQILTDRGSQSISSMFRHKLSSWGTQHSLTSVYYMEGDSITE
jgi:Integrase core domain